MMVFWRVIAFAKKFFRNYEERITTVEASKEEKVAFQCGAVQ